MESLDLRFSGKWLQRGFWLYVWEVTHPEYRELLYYVGRTGDSSSINAASPFNRIGQHLDLRMSASAAMLSKNLKKAGVNDITRCQFRIVAVGPLFPETSVKDRKNPTKKEKESHDRDRNKIAALERDLELAMRNAEYRVINKVKSKMTVDENVWLGVRSEFAKYFPRLNNITKEGAARK